MHLPVKKCAVINDFSGFGRCSLSVALPVLSAMGIQCCSLPTAILSNHTGYPTYFFDSYTDKMPSYISKWKKLNLEFDTIFSGFLGCKEQIDIVCDFFEHFKNNNPIIIVDPVMGDNGKIYTTYTPEMCRKMKKLAEKADIITPNITEACILSDIPYESEELSDDKAKSLIDTLCLNGERSVVLTGIIDRDFIKTAVFDKTSGKLSIVKNKRVKTAYPGTGDLFASVVCGAVSFGKGLFEAVEFASDFVEKTTEYTSKFDTDVNDGIAFEPFISNLINFKE